MASLILRASASLRSLAILSSGDSSGGGSSAKASGSSRLGRTMSPKG